MIRRSSLACALLLAFGLVHAEVPAPRDVPYAPGPITAEIDATNTAQRIIQVKQTIPVQAGPLTLLYPEWLPGNHSPRGPIDKIAGIRFEADGQALAWKRDPLNVYAFHLDVPQGVSSVVARFQYLTPTDASQGRVVMTPSMLNLQWNAVLLYPAGHYGSQIQFRPSVTYPAGFKAGTALDVASTNGDTVVYQPVAFDILADSPVYAGRYFKQIDLTPPGKAPVRLNVVADAPKYLEAKDQHVEQHRELVRQVLKLFGAEHYDHYDFLLSLSDQMAGNGLEHQRSSENGQELGYFKDWDAKAGSDDLLGHEFTHSWNGKYRRPADLWTPNFNVPMRDSLLWVYEGQTQYWGNVLTARAGLRSIDRSRDALAAVVATYADNRPGLSWRSVEDTTNDPIIAKRAPRAYRNWQMSEDYYSAGQLIWLGADALIREKTGNRKSLDDFARGFFGTGDGQWKSQDTYTFDDVVAALNDVVAYDWAGWLRERIDGKVSFADSVEATGWRLVYKDEPSAWAKVNEKAGRRRGGPDFTYSAGFSTDAGGKVGDVRWDGPAFDAGLGSGMSVVAVNEQAYSKDVMEDAIKAARTDQAPIRLLVKEFDRFRTLQLDYHGGLKYPHLERIEGRKDYLTPILTAK